MSTTTEALHAEHLELEGGPRRAQVLIERLVRYRRPAGWVVAASSAVGTLTGLLLSEHGPAILSGATRIAERGWPAVALAAVLVAFVAMVRVVGTVGGTIQLLHEQLLAERSRTDQALTRLEENQEQITVVLQRLVDRTQPGTGAPVTFPPAAPQVAVGG